MSSKLEKLIAAYEAEHASLSAELAECVADMDYGKARLFSKGVLKVNQHLQTLYNLRDERHDERERQMRLIELLEERVQATEDSDTMRGFYTQRLADEKEKLVNIPAAPAQRASASRAMHDLLGKLLVGELARFTFVLRASKRLHCHVRVVRKTLFLTVPEVRHHRANYTLQKTHLRKFRSLGFRLYDNKDKLILVAPYSTLAETDAVQRILARITFEVFYFKELAGETFITYYP